MQDRREGSVYVRIKSHPSTWYSCPGGEATEERSIANYIIIKSRRRKVES